MNESYVNNNNSTSVDNDIKYLINDNRKDNNVSNNQASGSTPSGANNI